MISHHIALNSVLVEHSTELLRKKNESLKDISDMPKKFCALSIIPKYICEVQGKMKQKHLPENNNCI